MPIFRRLMVILALVMVCNPHSTAQDLAGHAAADRLLPPSTLAYLELNDPAPFLSFFETPVWRAIYESPQSRQAWAAPQAQQLLALVSHVEQQAGARWPRIVRTLTDGGVYAAFDAGTQSAVLLARSSDPAARDAVIQTVVQTVRKAVMDAGAPDPYQPIEYRGLKGYQTAQGVMASVGPWLVITQKPALARWLADSYLMPGRPSLADEPAYQAARQQATGRRAGWGYARIGTLRAVGVGRKLFAGRHGNPAAELLVGGIIDALSKAEYLTVELRADDRGLGLSAAVPYDTATVAPRRQFFFAPADEGIPLRPLSPPGTLLNITAYRDVGAMWLSAPDLFDDNIATQLAQTDSGLSNFFGGRSFGQDILGQIGPRWQIIAARQTFEPGRGPVPALKLPAFALVFQTKNPQEMRPYMQVAFQTAVSIANIQATMLGAPTLMINNEKRDGLALSSAEYLAMPDEKAMTDGPIHFNFTPSMALVDDYVIIASTRALAESLAQLAAAPPSAAMVATNALLRLDGPAVLAALRDNRAMLIAQTMIRQSSDRSQAEAEVDLLLDLLTRLETFEVELKSEAQNLRLDIAFSVRDAQ